MTEREKGGKHKSLLRGYRLGTLFADETNLHSISFLHPSRTAKADLSPSLIPFTFPTLFLSSFLSLHPLIDLEALIQHSLSPLFLFLPTLTLCVLFPFCPLFFLNKNSLNDKILKKKRHIFYRNRNIFVLPIKVERRFAHFSGYISN